MGGLWSPYIVGLLASIGILAAVASLVWRHRHRSGGIELIAFLVVLFAWASIYCVGLLTHDPAMRLWLDRVMYLAIATVPVAWLVFTLVYTGHHHGASRPLAGVLAVVSLGIGILALTNPHHYLLWADTDVTVVEGIAVVQQQGGVLYLPVLAYIYGTVLLGSVVILRESVGAHGLYHDQTAVLLLGTGIPVGVSLVSNFGYVPIEGLSLTPYAFTVAGLAFGYAVLRIDLLDVLPATRTVGRDLAIEQLAEGVLVVDATGRIVDANEAGAAYLDRRQANLVGVDSRTLFDVGPDTGIDDLPNEVRIEGRLLELTTSPIHDGTDAPIGHTVVLRDVTDERLRKTQLEVLNRVLRHNLRNKLSIIQGHADVLAEEYDLNGGRTYSTITEAIDELVELSDRSREFERLKSLESLEATRVDIGAVIDDLVADLTAAHPDVTFEVSIEEPLVIESHREVLEIALENLLHNAVVHNDAQERYVAVTTLRTEFGVRIHIDDNGPGIPPDELQVLTSGRETSINHGSGLGLWVTKWAVQYLRGDIVFDHLEPRGTRASLSIPEIDETPDRPVEQLETVIESPID